MYYIHFKETIVPVKNLKSAYYLFMSNARFLIHKNLENYCEAVVYKDYEKKYNWIYCQELGPEFDDFNYDDDYDMEPLVFCPGCYFFFSMEVKNE